MTKQQEVILTAALLEVVNRLQLQDDEYDKVLTAHWRNLDALLGELNNGS